MQHMESISKTGSLARLRLEILADPPAIEKEWRALEAAAFGTLFQSYAWVSAWCKTAARAHGEEPAIAVWFDEDKSVAMIWPMAVASWRGARVLTWMGQGYTNYNMGLFRHDVAEVIDAASLRKLIADLSGRLPRVSALHLIDQPVLWNGRRNPFAELPNQPSINVSFEMDLQKDPQALFRSALSSDTRRRLERLERRLKETENVEFGWASTEEQRLTLLATFLQQKAAQFAKIGVADVFSDPSIQAFYRELYLEKTGAAFESAYVRVGGEIVATSNGMKFQDRFYHLTLSMSLEADDNLSPGRLLSREHVARQCREETAVFDFGPGGGRHKSAWHPRPLAYFETYMPLRRMGAPLTLLRRTISHCRNEVLSSPRMQIAIRRMKDGNRRLRTLLEGKSEPADK
jgi:CelD/BcsL family acetyltransferase involved in cellulose biosynthesis